MGIAVEAGPIAHIQHWANHKPNAIAIAGPSVSLTWPQLLESVTQVAGQLERQEAVGPALISADGEFERIYYLACIYLGLASASMPTVLSHEELAALGFRSIVTADKSTQSQHLQVVHVSPVKAEGPNTQPHVWQSNEVIKYVFSSGTTGTPKGAEFSFGLSNLRVVAASKYYMKQQPFLTLVGLSTTAGNTCFLLDLWRGSPNLVPGSSGSNLRLYAQHSPKGVMGSPRNLEGFASELSQSDPQQKSIEEAVSAGSFLNSVLAVRISEQMGCKVTNVYGSTEAGLIGFSDATIDSSSLDLYPDVDVIIVDNTGQPVSSEDSGYLLVRTPYTVPRYLGNVGSESFVGEFFKSGDQGSLNEHGQINLSGRDDDLINLSGLKIDPRPIEDHVMAKFGFRDAASMLATNQNGRQFHIMLVVSDGEIDEDGVRDYLFSVFHTSAPQRIQKVGSLPRNAMGKINRRVSISTPD
jgi:acyl-coenzyme A synthetase/AMP-(fatty) acid ligase